VDITGLISQDEGQTLEMKSSFRWDFDLNKLNKDLTKVAAKTVAGFLNVQGGTLLIGVDDDHQVIGIDMDLTTLKRQDKDGFEQVLRAGLATYLGPDISPLVGIQFHNVNDKIVAVATCPAHENPTFFRDGDRHEFYVRDGNLTRPLDVKSMHEYIRVHWHLEKHHEPDLEMVKEELLGAVPSVEDIRRVMGEVLAGYGLPREPLPATTQVLPAWLKVGTVRVLDLFLSALSRSPNWRQVFIISPWISGIDSAALPTSTLLKKLSDDQATAYLVTRPPTDEWHESAISAFGDGGRTNVALLPDLHMKLFVAVTTETTFAMLGSANFTAQSFANREIGVLVSATGEGAAVVRELKREAAQVYRSNARSLVHKAKFRSGR
jgi:hypothetical protein